MHELSIAAEVVEIACARAEGKRVKRLVLEVGKLTAVMPDALQFCFPLAAEGTDVEGASLEIRLTEGRGRCKKCQAEQSFDQPYGECPCGGFEFDWLSGEELAVREVEVH